jgi:hypothetical protein
MKKLLITLMLISPFSFADWGDVYYCQMTSVSETTVEGKRTDYQLEKFTFKLDQTKNAMVFGKGGYYDGVEYELKEMFKFPSQETWYADDKFAISYFGDGKLLSSHTSSQGITSMSADCDKF